MDLPPASDSAVSRSEDEEQDKEEQYHVHFDKNVKRGSGMARVPRKRKSVKAPVSTTCYHSYVDKYLSTHFLLLSLHASDDGIVRGYESNIFSSPTARRPLIGFHSSSDSP